MTIAVTGAGGQLGGELCRQLGDDAIALTRKDMDLSNPMSIEQTLATHCPDAVINAAAYTAVDKAEEDQQACHVINGQSVAVMADICDDLNIPFVQVSTDYVFERSDSRQRHAEDAPTLTPSGVYARSKLIGEKNAARCRKHIIVRTCGLYTSDPTGPVRGRNFVDTMLSLGLQRDQLSVVCDQSCTPTYVPDLAAGIIKLLRSERRGTFHVTNSGETTWFEFASEIFRMAELDVALTPISTEQYGAPAPRPRYSVLDVSKYGQATGTPMRSWQEALEAYFVASPIASVFSSQPDQQLQPQLS